MKNILHEDPNKNWLIQCRLKQLSYNRPLYLAAVAAYDLLTSTQEIRPLSNVEHSKVIDDLSKALLDIEE